MHSLSVLGPLHSDEGDAFIPVLFSSDGPPRMLEGASTLAGAVFAARRALPANADVLVDEALGPHAHQPGWRTGPLAETERVLLAATAVALNSQETLQKLSDGRLILELLAAAAAFTRARPWRRFLSELTLHGRATGPGGGAVECTVLGGGGEQFGLVLYDSPGGHERVLDLVDSRSPGAATQVDSLACLIDFDDDFVARAMTAAFGVEASLMLLRFKKGRPQPLRPDEARRLIATLKALTTAAEEGGTASASQDGVSVSFDVRHFLPPGQPPVIPSSVRAEVEALRAHPLHTLDRQLMPKLVDFARAHVPGFVAPPPGPGADFALFLATTLQPFDGRTVAQRFLADGAPTAEERTWLEAKLKARVSLWEVEATDLVEEVALVDLFDGRRVVVHDAAGADRLFFRDGLLGAVVAADGTNLLVASHPVTFPPGKSRAVRDALSSSPPEPAALLAAWEREAVAPPGHTDEGPGLTTTDGEPFLPCTDLYALDKRARVLTTLDARPDFSRTGDQPASWSWSKRGNALHASWWKTALADLTLTPQGLVTSASSVERLDRLRALLEQLLGDAVHFEARQLLPVGEAWEMVASADAQPMPQGPWMRVFRLLTLKSALPRSAADAHLQACAVEREEAREDDVSLDGDGQPMALTLRRLLGVDPDGQEVGPDEWFATFGAGLPLSLTLQSVVAPMMLDLHGTQAEQLRDSVRLAWAAWNAAKETDDDAQALRAARAHLGLDAPAPKSKKRKAKPGALEPRFELAANAPVLEEALPWAIRRVRTEYPFDRRQVMGVAVRPERGSLFTTALWTLSKSDEARVLALGYTPGQQPLATYDEEFDPLEAPFSWRAVAPPWRRALVADWYRDGAESFDGDFAAQVAAHVAVLDALAGDTVPGLRDAWEDLFEDELPGFAAARLASGVRTVPELDLRRPGKGFREALERFLKAGGRLTSGGYS
ncbi:MAG: hypothetical protein AMXMBFR34_31240 [Myxococcaceae bacterium]